jgi:hypothetical protein
MAKTPGEGQSKKYNLQPSTPGTDGSSIFE